MLGEGRGSRDWEISESGVSLGNDENVLEFDSGDACTK